MCKRPEYYDREKLYEEVWAKPLSKIARLMPQSDSSKTVRMESVEPGAIAGSFSKRE